MHPPAEIVRGVEGCLGVLFLSESRGVEHAQQAQRIGEIGQPAVELAFQQAARFLPLALENDQIAASQVGTHVRGALPAAPLGSRGHSPVAQQLRKVDVDAFFADVFGVHGLGIL